MTRDYNIAIASTISMIVQNNAGCVARKLREVGYETKDYIPSPELESALFKVHMADPKLFFEVMRKCEWNYGIKNWTNEEKVRERLISAVQSYTGVKVDKDNWWNTTMNYLEEQSVN